MMKKIILSLLVFFSVNSQAGVWDNIKKGVSDAGEAISDGAKSLTEETPPDQIRAEIDAMEKETVANLLGLSASAKDQFNSSYGYAVFDTRKFSFLITTEYGPGVAVNRSNGKRIYMKMASGGVNVGLGGEFYQVVFLFENEAAFNQFVNDGHQVGSEAAATAGDDSARTEVKFVNGIAMYKLNSKGLKLTLDITGTKFWKDEDLN
jgi:lipid-binding SYLF domain-containing protein